MNLLISPYLWIGVVVGAFCLNLCAMWVQGALNRRAIKAKWPAERAKKLEQIEEVLAEPDGLVLLAAREIQCAICCCILCVFGFFLAGLAWTIGSPLDPMKMPIAAMAMLVVLASALLLLASLLMSEAHRLHFLLMLSQEERRVRRQTSTAV